METTTPPPVSRAVLAFADEHAMGQALADALGAPLHLIERHRFPDGELKLTLPPRLPADVVLLRSLHQPNEKLVELLLTAPAARTLGARRVLLASPYLAYMRQDMAFTPGEVVSQRHVGGWLAEAFDAVVTVDPHLHRIAALDEVMPACQAVSLSAAKALGAWIAQQVPGALLLGPDEESGQWVRRAAAAAGLDHAVCVKQRFGDRDVEVAMPAVDVRGRAVVLMDDMASTGRTLIGAARQCGALGAASVDVAVSHALFVGDAMPALRAAGVRHVWSTDCVPHESNVVSVVPLLAGALRDLMGS
jgi:ribose-phosphate pyrophosphokinase